MFLYYCHHINPILLTKLNQFDRHKLTFYFEADGRIDFRELVRDLFSIYKTRIWMQQLDKAGPRAAELDLADISDDEGGQSYCS